MADPRRRKKSPTEELFRKVLEKMGGSDQRLASIEQQLVLVQHELSRHGRLIEEINQSRLETLGLRVAAAEDAEDEDGDA